MITLDDELLRLRHRVRACSASTLTVAESDLLRLADRYENGDALGIDLDELEEKLNHVLN